MRCSRSCGPAAGVEMWTISSGGGLSASFSCPYILCTRRCKSMTCACPQRGLHHTPLDLCIDRWNFPIWRCFKSHIILFYVTGMMMMVIRRARSTSGIGAGTAGIAAEIAAGTAAEIGVAIKVEMAEATGRRGWCLPMGCYSCI